MRSRVATKALGLNADRRCKSNSFESSGRHAARAVVNADRRLTACALDSSRRRAARAVESTRRYTERAVESSSFHLTLAVGSIRCRVARAVLSIRLHATRTVELNSRQDQYQLGTNTRLQGTDKTGHKGRVIKKRNRSDQIQRRRQTQTNFHAPFQ